MSELIGKPRDQELPFGHLEKRELVWAEYVDMSPGTVIFVPQITTSYVFSCEGPQDGGKKAYGRLQQYDHAKKQVVFEAAAVTLDLSHPVQYLNAANESWISFVYGTDDGETTRITPPFHSSFIAYDPALKEQIDYFTKGLDFMRRFRTPEFRKTMTDILGAIADSGMNEAQELQVTEGLRHVFGGDPELPDL